LGPVNDACRTASELVQDSVPANLHNACPDSNRLADSS
jgi:hypothetical protein